MTVPGNDVGYDLRDNHLDIAVVLFDICRFVSVDGGREPTLTEAKALYRRWFLVEPDNQAVA